MEKRLSLRPRTTLGGLKGGTEARYECSMSSPPTPLSLDSESTEPLSVDGISSDLEEPAEGEEEEEDEGQDGGHGSGGLQGGSPRTPDQEQFLRRHFETLANGAAPGVARGSGAWSQYPLIISRPL